MLVQGGGTCMVRRCGGACLGGAIRGAPLRHGDVQTGRAAGVVWGPEEPLRHVGIR